MRLRGGKITITELESIYGLEIFAPNRFRINNLRSFIQNERLWCALQKHLEAMSRDHGGHLVIFFQLTLINSPLLLMKIIFLFGF